MASSSGISEIVEYGDDINLSSYFNRPKPIKVKPRDGEVKSSNYPTKGDISRLIEAIDLRTSPRIPTYQMTNEIQRKTLFKNPIKISASQASGGSCISESLTLKQALRRLCISQASEHAAMKRSSKPNGFPAISEAGTIKRLFASVMIEGTKSNLSTGEVKRKFLEASLPSRTATSNSCPKTSQVYDASNTNSSSKKNETKITIQDVIASPSKASELGIKRRSNPKPSSKTSYEAETGTNKIPFKANLSFTKKGRQEPPFKVKKTPNSREKGDCSQSSISSLGDYSSSTTTSLSGESSQSRSSGNAIRPHMSKDVKWVAIHHALSHHGSLTLMNFKLVKKLGCGDIGTVYLAELTGSGCLFALKVMDVEFLLSRKKILRAQSEREILQILDHPFLPTLYAHFTTDNLSCLVMEYCPGGDLHVLRQRQPGRRFSEPAARFYVAEVLLALEYLHMLGVIYRDLKPENILVREDGHIMLSDFDLSLRCTVNPTLLKSSSLDREEAAAKMAGPCAESSCIGPNCLHPSLPQVSCFTPRLLSSKNRKTGPDSATQVSPLPQLVVEPTGARSNSFVGTHEYLAPEIIKGDGHGSAVDWWTYGIFLYELLYGRTPFKGPGNEETLSNVVSQNLRFPETPSVSVRAIDLVKGLLVKDPENRLGSVMGAAEIKRHPFFEGLNWALIRCAAPPEVPGSIDPALGYKGGMDIELF